MNYSFNLKMTPVTPHTIIQQKAKLIHWAIIKPNNRCSYVLNSNTWNQNLLLGGWYPYMWCSEPNSNWGWGGWETDSIIRMTPKTTHDASDKCPADDTQNSVRTQHFSVFLSSLPRVHAMKCTMKSFERHTRECVGPFLSVFCTTNW